MFGSPCSPCCCKPETIDSCRVTVSLKALRSYAFPPSPFSEGDVFGLEDFLGILSPMAVRPALPPIGVFDLTKSSFDAINNEAATDSTMFFCDSGTLVSQFKNGPLTLSADYKIVARVAVGCDSGCFGFSTRATVTINRIYTPSDPFEPSENETYTTRGRLGPLVLPGGDPVSTVMCDNRDFESFIDDGRYYTSFSLENSLFSFNDTVEIPPQFTPYQYSIITTRYSRWFSYSGSIQFFGTLP